MSGGLSRDRGLEGNFWQERSLTSSEWDRENFGTCLETATTCDVIKGKKKISNTDQRSRRGGVVDVRHSDDSEDVMKSWVEMQRQI